MNRLTFQCLITICPILIVVLISCSESPTRVSGRATGWETPTAQIKGTAVYSDGSKAAGAHV